MGTNPFKIPIGTSNPVNLCDGLPLFPVLGTARAGVAASSRSYNLFDGLPLVILITRLNISATAGYAFGICGPAIAFLSEDVDVSRENSGHKGELTLTFNRGLTMSAGTFVGAALLFGVTVNLQVLAPKPWWKVWALTWRDAFTINANFTLDLLNTLFKLAQYLLSKSSKTLFTEDTQNRLKAAVPFVKTFSLQDTVGGSTVTPNLRATPKMTFPINIVNSIPKLKAFNDSLSKIGGEISVGPSIHLEFPVTFNFDSFNIVGGLAGGATSADYGKEPPGVQYAQNSNQVSATGSTQFDVGKKPSKVTTNVKYTTALALTISLHFRITLSKFFNIGVNTPSLDLTNLLYGVPERDRTTFPVTRPISTNVPGGCVLTPNMTLTFTGPNGSRTNFRTDQKLKGTITLPGLGSSNAADVNLVIEPPVAGFPTKLTIRDGQETASFDFTFPKQCLPTGNRNAPSETAPAGPLTPLQTYSVRARLASDSNNVCSDYEVEVPLDIHQRFIRCQRASTTTAGAAPSWDRLAGASINANPSLPMPSGVRSNSASLILTFPYLDTIEPLLDVPVTFTLLDENRQPHTRSNVQLITILGLQRALLKPSATGRLKLARTVNIPNTILTWESKGPFTGFSNRFYLIVNAGCLGGQTEFWFDVWNWS